MAWLLATDLKTIGSRRRGNFKHSFIDGPDGFCSTKSPEGVWNGGVNRATRRTLSTIEEL